MLSSEVRKALNAIDTLAAQMGESIRRRIDHERAGQQETEHDDQAREAYDG